MKAGISRNKMPNFHHHCLECQHYWHHTAATPAAFCPNCESENIKEVPHYVVNLSMVDPRNRTGGPRTEAGKRKSSMNAYKHGMYSRKQTIAPALTGKYMECNSCKVRAACEEGFEYCPVKFSQYIAMVDAIKDGNTEALKHIQAANLSHLQTIFQQIIANIYEDGLMITEKKSFTNKSGEKIESEEHVQNPLLRRLLDLAPLIGATGAEQEVTPRSKDEIETMRGYIDSAGEDSNSLREVVERNRKELQEFREEMKQKANELRQKDDALAEFEKDKQ
jgi:hypothetical protein